MYVRYPFWTGRKKELAQKPPKEEARMIESPMCRLHFRYIDRKSKNSAAYRVLRYILVIIPPCSAYRHSCVCTVSHRNEGVDSLKEHYETRPLICGFCFSICSEFFSTARSAFVVVHRRRIRAKHSRFLINFEFIRVSSQSAKLFSAYM